MNKEKLYEAFGELIYAIAKADGLIQEEEISALEEILKNHPWAKDVKWSFDYEVKKQNPFEEVFAKALDTFQQYGPSNEYVELMGVIEEIAKASKGVDDKEKEMMQTIQVNMMEIFMQELKARKLID